MQFLRWKLHIPPILAPHVIKRMAHTTERTSLSRIHKKLNVSGPITVLGTGIFTLTPFIFLSALTPL
jgi:hypothetical protein